MSEVFTCLTCPICGRESDNQELIKACASQPPLYVPPYFQTGRQVDLLVVPSANGSAPQFQLASALTSAEQVIVQGFVNMTLEVMEGDMEPKAIRLTLGQPAYQWHLIHRLMLRVQVEWRDQRHFVVVPTTIYRRTVFLRLLD